MCIDFTDLNWACPKDSYPLIRIDALVDSMAGCEMMSLLDALQGYEPPPPPDNKKRSSETERKNDSPKQIPVSRSREGTALLQNSEKGGWILMEQGMPGSVRNLKEYMSKPPLLIKPQAWERLYIYLLTSEEAVSVVLVRTEGKEHQPVYYVSKLLQGAEPRYPQIEKLVLALIVAARKLHPYFQSHHVTVLTNQPLKHILASPNASGRMTKWAVELSEHDIEFEPRLAIKAQALADFILEATGDEDSKHLQEWTMFVDGSSTSSKSGVGIVIKSLKVDYMEYAITLEFPVSNNEAEYEAILLGCRLIRAAGARKVRAYSDSQLVVSQAEGEYEVRQEKMTKYLAKLREEIEKFEEFRLEQIPREQNLMADQLPKLASSNQFDEGRKITLLSAAKPAVISEEEKKREIEGVFIGENLTHIVQFLTKGTLPEDRKEARKVKLRSARFVLIDGDLYKRGFSSPLLKCLGPDRGECVLSEVHEETCKPSANPATFMKTLESPCPFDMWSPNCRQRNSVPRKEAKELVRGIEDHTVIYIRNWVHELPGVLWAYCTTPRESMQETPFSLVYETEAVLPTEIGEETWRIRSYDSVRNSEFRRGDLDLVEEKRELAERRVRVYKSKMARAHNDKVRPRKFEEGDLVLRKTENTGPIGGMDLT
ncbi:UNVERIFIED_CONTAM: hypothetical protein Slati_2780400 [Sesamum latifolium]|uniref:RNase H type-1 domain-containing protein n=1 Tax=Sesamum latifolium TaxID=2727402 RepID=A0AAW2W169_9LAMI